MARIKINQPPSYSFSTIIPIRITDINYGGHVGNNALLGIIHEARIQFLSSYGYSEMNIEGLGLIMADVAIEFKSEIFYGDDITACVTASDIGKIGFDLIYKLEKINKDQTTTIAAIAKTGMICFDYSQKKVACLPTKAFRKLAS